MMSARGTEYDPDLLQVFVNEVGQFPPGSLLELKDRTWGLVVSGARSPASFSKPLLRIVRLANGDSPEVETLVDLAEEGSLLRVIEPADTGLWERVVLWEPEPEEEPLEVPEPEALASEDDEAVHPALARDPTSRDPDSADPAISGSVSKVPESSVGSVIAQLRARRKRAAAKDSPSVPFLDAADEALLHELEHEGSYLPELLDEAQAEEAFDLQETGVEVVVDEDAGTTEAQEDELALLASMFSARPSRPGSKKRKR
jgi:hypothetical protein